MKEIIKIPAIFLLTIIIAGCGNENVESFAYGNFEAEELLVPAEASALLDKLFIKEGDLLIKGKEIALLDTLQLHLKRVQLIAAKSAIEARVTQLSAQVKVQEVSLSNLDREYHRFLALFKEDAATRKQLDDIEGQMEVLKAQISALESQTAAILAERNAQDAQILQVEDQLKRSLITSPSDGQVLELFVRQGEMALAGRPVIKMADLSMLTLRVFIDGNQLSSIKIGDAVKVLYDGTEDLRYIDGRITWVSPEAEFTPKIIQTRDERVNLVYAVKVLVPNNGELKIGMPGEIQLIHQ